MKTNQVIKTEEYKQYTVREHQRRLFKRVYKFVCAGCDREAPTVRSREAPTVRSRAAPTVRSRAAPRLCRDRKVERETYAVCCPSYGNKCNGKKSDCRRANN